MDAGASPREGANINGPSVIRIPDWIAPERRADSRAVYAMYFAHHQGAYIRLAWAEEVTGPWHLVKVGAEVEIGRRGVLDMGADREIALDHGIAIREHVASPDVFVDEGRRRIVMVFHGPAAFEGKLLTPQRSFVATSPDGLDFNGRIRSIMLGPSYFRLFRHGGEFHAISNGGRLHRALDPDDPWTAPHGFDFGTDLWTTREDNPFTAQLLDAGSLSYLRHATVRVADGTLHLFYTRIRDSPERILYSTIDLSAGGFETWTPTFPPEEILRPTLDWEGGDVEAEPSMPNFAPEDVNQLRDPYLFEDMDGTLYLFYSGRGEDAIGIARIDPVTRE